MKKAGSLVSLVAFLIVVFLMTGCSQPQYVKIGELGGTTLNLDVASVVYNKDKDIANYKIKTTFDENAKAARAAAWSKSGVNPFVDVAYLLIAQEMKINDRTFRATEFSFFDKNDKVILKETVPADAHWAALDGDLAKILYYEVARRIK
jgi:hypothetical protein